MERRTVGKKIGERISKRKSNKIRSRKEIMKKRAELVRGEEKPKRENVNFSYRWKYSIKHQKAETELLLSFILTYK